MVYSIYLHLTLTIHVGKYTNPMVGMGIVTKYQQDIPVWWRWTSIKISTFLLQDSGASLVPRLGLGGKKQLEADDG